MANEQDQKIDHTSRCRGQSLSFRHPHNISMKDRLMQEASHTIYIIILPS